MSELPKGWIISQLDKLCSIQVGRKDVNEGNPLGKYDFFTCAAEPLKSDTYSFEGESILLPGNGANVGLSIYYDGKFEAYQRTYVLNNLSINGRFIYYYIQAFWKQSLEGKQYGSATNYIRLSNIRDFNVTVPPLNEQRRIVAKLDRLFACSRSAREELGRIPRLCDRYKQAVLVAACSGRLTADWREQNNRSKDWIETTVGKLIDGIEAGINVKCEERPPLPHEFALVKISAVTWGTYDDDKSKTLPQGQSVPESNRIKVGDFLISRANTLELVGACVIVKRVTRPVFLSDKVLRVLVQENYKRWLLLWLRSKDGRYQIEQLASGNQLSMRNLSQANLKSIQLKLPPEDERNEIISRVEKLFKAIDLMAQEYQKASKLLDRLDQATLAKAFRGELVPQDPNDEPAAALLERILAERQNQTPAKRGSTKKAR